MIKSKNLLRYSILVVFLLSLLYSFYQIQRNNIPTHYQEGNIQLQGKIHAIQIEGDKVSITLKAKEKLLVSYYLKTFEEKETISTWKLGDILLVSGVANKPSPNTVFSGFNYQHYLYSNQIYFVVTADTITKQQHNSNWFYHLKNKIYERIDRLQSKEYVRTFLLGDKSLLEDEIVTSYQKNGVSHLFAISGMHVSLLALILEKLLHKITKHSYMIISAFLLFYMALADFSPSIVRACFFFIGSKIPLPKQYVLLGIASILLCYHPYYLYHVGFLFSFIISFYLIVFGKWSTYFHHYLSKLGITSLICFVVSIPIMIGSFHEINLLSPIFNLLFVPLVSFIIFPLSLLTFIFPFLDSIFLFCTTILEKCTLFCNQFSLPLVFCSLSAILLYGYYGIITLVLIQPKKWYLLCLCLFVHFCYPKWFPASQLTMLEIGQGDSFLLEHQNTAILIDTGGVESYAKEPWQMRPSFSLAKGKIIPYLKSRGISTLDALIITHGDSDHAKEAVDLLQNFNVKQVIMNEGNNNSLEETILKIITEKKIKHMQIATQTIQVKNVLLQFLNDSDSANENEDSLVFLTKIQNRNILFVGDAGKETESYLLDEYNLPKVDILKVGHHGSKNSSSETFIEAIRPTYGFISAKANNRYGHPHKEVLDILKANQTIPYVTSIDGSVKINLKTLNIDTCSKVYANGC